MHKIEIEGKYIIPFLLSRFEQLLQQNRFVFVEKYYSTDSYYHIEPNARYLRVRHQKGRFLSCYHQMRGSSLDGIVEIEESFAERYKAIRHKDRLAEQNNLEQNRADNVLVVRKIRRNWKREDLDLLLSVDEVEGIPHLFAELEILKESDDFVLQEERDKITCLANALQLGVHIESGYPDLLL